MKEIICTNGEVVLCDDEDYLLLSRFKWFMASGVDKGRPYPHCAVHGRYNTCKQIPMHKLVMGGANGIDHIDTNQLNNQKYNLRNATKSQNGANARKMQIRNGKPTSSKYKGVFFDSRIGKFRARVTKDKKPHDCGAFCKEEDAARAYNAMAQELHGPYARLNEVN